VLSPGGGFIPFLFYVWPGEGNLSLKGAPFFQGEPYWGVPSSLEKKQKKHTTKKNTQKKTPKKKQGGRGKRGILTFLPFVGSLLKGYISLFKGGVNFRLGILG